MKCIADTWYVPFADLVGQCLIGCDTIKWGIKTNSPRWQSIADPDDRRKRLIRYDTMAIKYQTLVRRVLCNGLEPWEVKARPTHDVLSERSLPEQVEQVLKDGFRRYVGLYPATDTTPAARKTQTCLARAAATIELIGHYVQANTIDPRSYVPYRDVISWLNQDGNYDYYFPKGNQYLPTNEVRLKEKVVLRYGKPGCDPKPITDVIHLPRKDNKNRDEFAGDAELMAWITMGMASGTTDPKAYTIRKVSEVCRLVGRDVPSPSWFSNVLASPKMQQITAEARHGKGTKHGSRYTHSITMARAMNAGDCWMMDATRVNFIEHRTSNKDEYRFLFVIVIRDAYSGEVVGCHFDTKEDRWGYTNALKMAVKTTGYLPHTLVYDQFPGHLTDEMATILSGIEAKGTHLVCTHKATGKALLERWFDTLQTVFLTKSRYYYGQGIMSTREYAHRSPDYLVKTRKLARAEGWDFDQAWQEAWRCLEEYRQTPVSHYSKKQSGLHLSPAQLHSQSEKPNTIGLEVWEQASLFWMTKVLDIRRNSLAQTVHGVEYEYMIYDTELLYRYERVAIRYEEHDPKTVMLFAVGADDRVSDFFICELTHTPPIVMYGPDAESSRLAGRQAKIKRVEDQKRADLNELLNGTTVDPEYLLTMGGKVGKDEFESAATAVIYEQMGVSMAADAQTPASKRKGKAVATPPDTPTKPPEPFDPKAFINHSFYHQ